MRIMQAGAGPAITITAMSELESDSETGGNGSIRAGSTGSGGQGPGGMTYLSPFTVITSCASRTASESNLSSSGYSSMASPGPSRSGSSNPLCISESEDTSTPTRASGVFFPKLTVPGMYVFSIQIFKKYEKNILKEGYCSKVGDIFIPVLTAQTAQKIKFIFSNVA